MTAELESEAQLEIGHVLFMDIVGFSKLMVDEQSDASQQLNQIVRNTEQFRAAEAANKLTRLPTGDGMVLVFYTSPEAPARCSMEIGRALKDSSFGLRMGIHSGPVNKVLDVNDRSNLAGTGINMAQRLMDCGDAGHILLSRRVTEDLEQHSKWRPRLHHLGEFEVKHGVKIDIVNLYTDEVGNPALPQRLKDKKITPASPHARFAKPLIAAAFLAIISLVGIWFFAHRAEQKSRTVSTPVPASVPEKSIAILPFKPLSSQNRDEVLENGMADTLIAKLSTIREIIIPSLTSTRKYDEQEQDPLSAGRLLHVRSVLEGTLQKLGDRIRVTARLINVADGSSLWTGTFDEKFTDVFAVQDTIAQKVATALALQLSGEEQQRLTKRYTENTEAYQLYLKGRFYWNKYTEEAFRKSIDYFNQALEKDSNYALAYSGLADAYSLLGEFGSGPPQETFGRARNYAEKAIALDDSLADAHLSLGIVRLFYDWDLAGARRELERAKQLNPNNAQVYHFYGHCLQISGRLTEAIAETKRGLDLDPTNLILNNELALAYQFAGKYDEALAQYRRTLEMDPGFTHSSGSIASVYEELGKFDDALAQLNKLKSVLKDDPGFLSDLGYVQAKLGNSAEARNIAEQLERRRTHEFIDAGYIAMVYAGLGDADRTFAWLEKHFQERGAGCPWLKLDVHFKSLRSDPRFIDLTRRIGL